MNLKIWFLCVTYMNLKLWFLCVTYMNFHNINTETQSSCLHRASTVSKHFFIIPTDAHNYKTTGMLKTIKIPTIAPTCFDSRRNHHQGAISCLAKTTIMILLCLSSMTWSMPWWRTSLCASVWYTVEEGQLHTGWYAAMALTTSLTTSTIES